MSKYVASCTELESRSLDEIEVIAQEERSALGEEILNAFDMDLGLKLSKAVIMMVIIQLVMKLICNWMKLD